ncbi:MAG: nitrous oxide reductase family maturation protein NosD [Gemmatimonadota bacterium]
MNRRGARCPVRFPLRGLGMVAAACLLAPPAFATDIVVSPAGPVPTLTAGLALARPGDRIIVRAGIYREPPIVVAKRVSIVGEGRPVLDGGGDRQILTVTADSVTIRGLVFRHTGNSFVDDRAALRFTAVRGCVVEDNEFESTFFGIYLADVEGCRISGNRLAAAGAGEAQSGNGIHLWSSAGVVIERNAIRGHRDGIYLEFSRGAVVRGNASTHNLRYGLHFMFSDSCTYADNTFRRNGAGVAVMYSKRVSMTGNRFQDNQGAAAYGLLLKDISDSRVAANRFVGNTVGLYTEGGSRLRVEDNLFERNGWAVRLLASSGDDAFLRNRFVGNAFDVTTNSASSSSTFRENEWDRYAGYDLDRDGYGDVPYRPVRLFALVVEQSEPALILLRSVFVDLLEVAERVLPVLTPETLVDERPRMPRRRPILRSAPRPPT